MQNFFQAFYFYYDLFFHGCLSIFHVDILWQYIWWWSLMCKICCHHWTILSAHYAARAASVCIILPPGRALSKSWENIYTSQFSVPGLFSSQIIWEWNNVRGGHNLQRYYTLGHRGCLASGTLPSQKKSTLLAKNIALLQQIPLRLSARQPHLFYPFNSGFAHQHSPHPYVNCNQNLLRWIF